MTVDYTAALISSYEEIRSGLWWVPPNARDVDNGDFYAQMKAPICIRDNVDGQIRYRWIESGPWSTTAMLMRSTTSEPRSPGRIHPLCVPGCWAMTARASSSSATTTATGMIAATGGRGAIRWRGHGKEKAAQGEEGPVQ